jgi:phage shock protein C
LFQQNEINIKKTYTNKNMKKKLERSNSKKMIGGVASGLAEYFDIDVTLVRVLFLVAIFAPIPAIIPYIAFWIAMPVKQEYQNMVTQ